MNDINILVQLFQFAENGGEMDREKVISALSSYGLSHDPLTVETVFKKIRVGSKNAITFIDNCLDESLERVKIVNKAKDDIIKEFGTLPEGASLGDDKETIRFIKSLTDDFYNFSDASRLIGLTRQTIKEHADKNLFNLKTIRKGKSDYITRDDIIIYYRNYYNKDGFGF